MEHRYKNTLSLVETFLFIAILDVEEDREKTITYDNLNVCTSFRNTLFPIPTIPIKAVLILPLTEKYQQFRIIFTLVMIVILLCDMFINQCISASRLNSYQAVRSKCKTI